MFPELTEDQQAGVAEAIRAWLRRRV